MFVAWGMSLCRYYLGITFLLIYLLTYFTYFLITYLVTYFTYLLLNYVRTYLLSTYLVTYSLTDLLAY